MEAAPVEAGATAQKGNVFKTVFDELFRLWKAPAMESPLYIQSGNWVVALGFILLQGICAGVFAAFCVREINGVIAIGGSFTESVMFSGVKAFFLALLYSVVLSVVFAGLLLVAGKIVKSTLTPQEAACMASLRAIVLAPLSLFSCVVFLFSIPAGLIVFYLVGTVAGVCSMAVALESRTLGNRNQKVYLLIAVAVIFLIVYLLFAGLALPSFYPPRLRILFAAADEFLTWDSITQFLDSFNLF